MKYCTDTGFILALFSGNAHARTILSETRTGKIRLLIPIVVYAESIKKLLQQGISMKDISEFYEMVTSSEKVEISFLDRTIAQAAALLSLSSPLHMIDAFVAATARHTGCDALLASDNDYAPLAKKRYLKIQSW